MPSPTRRLRRGGPLTSIRVLLTLITCFSLLLAGCSSSASVPTTEVPPATKAPKPTFTAVPSKTLEPTLTPSPEATPTLAVTAVPPTPTPVPTAVESDTVSPLTGMEVDDAALLRRRVLAVRVGNDATIRPQEGLGVADIVYEEIMEGWTLTRFTALFLESDAERIRPIRSARLASLQIAPQYDAALVHSGASDEIRYMISQASFVDLDQYYHPDPYGVLSEYDWRGRMYTSVEAVHEYLVAKGWENDTRIKGYRFDRATPEGEPATNVHIPYPELCVVDWQYEADSGCYLRSVQGEPHLDGLTDTQIGAENVIMLYAEHRATDIVEDSLGSTAINIVLSGSGKAQIVRDGVVLDATWKRDGDNGLIRYYDDAGAEIGLKPGKTWIQLVPTDYEITYGA